MDLQVIKRDGTSEPFSDKKIMRVVIAAGLTKRQAHIVVARLNAWAREQKGEVTSLQIRDQVLTEMQAQDAYSANMYAWYQKTKDKQ